MNYDSLLLVSFGGPEKREEVVPFLENVLRGKNVPRERMLEVAEHYYHFDGKSPINDQNRRLKDALQNEFGQHGPALPIYWGNRNWAPYLTDAIDQMKRDGVKRALAFVTSAYSSYSGCRQYREDIERARAEVGPGAPQVDKLRVFYNHPGFLQPVIKSVKDAIASLPPQAPIQFLFTAHSIPLVMAAGSQYAQQVKEATGIVAEELGLTNWSVAWQSRSGPPSQPWLGPDVSNVLEETTAENVIVVPIGFVSDHMEVLFDLDVEAREICERRGIRMVRAKTPGTDPQFVQMIRELVLERMNGAATERRFMGVNGPSHDACPVDCCPKPQRPHV